MFKYSIIEMGDTMQEILNKIKKSSKIIEENQFDEVFDTAFENMKSTFIKLEVEQYYECDMGIGYNNYVKGNYKGLTNVFTEFYRDWSSIFEKKSSIEVKRLHLISTPITEYINYEMYFYLMNEKVGEKIKCLNFNDTKYKFGELNDFIIFDNEVVIINCHNKEGKYLNSYYYNEDKSLINDLLKEYDELYKIGNNYKDYANFDFELLNKMKINNLKYK